MRRYLTLYWLFLQQQLKIVTEYRVNFFVGVASTVFLQAAALLTIWIVMGQIPNLNGWSFDEILLIYGLLTTSKAINHMFADNLWVIGRAYIRPGTFDRFLVRPINPLFHLLVDRFCHDGIGNLLIGGVLIATAFTNLGIAWSVASVAYVLLAVLSGGVIFIALNLLTATSAFWIVESIPVTQSVFNFNDFARYPLPIYQQSIQILLTWLIPYGFASFYPASYLVGRDVGVLAWLGPLVALLLLVLAYRVWLFGLRHYTSTGS
jgi:ABC-2 type transport system permease protein